jgi:hypothetical protein
MEKRAMSHSVNDLASSFVEMAQAYKRLPEVENDLTAAINTINSLNDNIMRLETKLMDRHNTIVDLKRKNIDLEVANTAMELRFLECDDAKQTLVRTLESLGREIADVLEAVRPLPVPEIEEVKDMVAGEVALIPFVHEADTPSAQSEATDSSIGEISSLQESGQSEADPTSAEHSALEHHGDSISQVSVSQPQNEGVSVPSDPIPSTDVPVDGSSQTAPQSLPLASVTPDDIGYHNEPSTPWIANWYRWADRMDARYGKDHWPQR